MTKRPNRFGPDGPANAPRPGRKTTKGDVNSIFEGETRIERAAVAGYSIHLTQVGVDWWGWTAFKGRTPVGREDFHAAHDVAIHEANEFVRRHMEKTPA